MLGVIPDRRQPAYLRPEESLGTASFPHWEELESSVFVGQDIHSGECKEGSYWELITLSSALGELVGCAQPTAELSLDKSVMVGMDFKFLFAYTVFPLIYLFNFHPNCSPLLTLSHVTHPHTPLL